MEPARGPRIPNQADEGKPRLARVFNPTETKKNGPARRQASMPERRSASPFTAISQVQILSPLSTATEN
jgi:hypothetical protein